MRIRVLVNFLLFPFLLEAQHQSLETDQGIPPAQYDSSVIDRMNARSLEFNIALMEDSCAYYAETAYQASVQSQYIHGIAVSLLRKSAVAEHFYSNFGEAKRLAEQSVQWFRKTPNQSYLEESLGQLSFLCFVTGSYDRAFDLAKESFHLYDKNQDELGKFSLLISMASIQTKKGVFEDGFEYCKKALQIAVKLKDTPRIKSCQTVMGHLCMSIEDYVLALHYFRTVFTDFTKEDLLIQSIGEYDVWSQMEFAEIYSHLNMHDSALRHYNLFDSLHAPEKDLRIYLVSKGEYFMLTGQYDQALPLLLRGLAIHQKLRDANEIMRAMLDVANTYLSLDNKIQALIYGRQGLKMARQIDNRQFIRDGNKILFSVYEKMGQTDSAYSYYRSYIEAKESLAADQIKGKFSAYNFEQKIELLNNEKLISEQKLKIQDQQLKNETLLRNLMIAFVFVVLGLSFLILRNTRLKRRNEKLTMDNTRRELEHKTTEMEMQALRAQMNPHFIFNCLNSINRFIMKNESQVASDYLTQFSRLIRLVLINSKRPWIPLEEEIDMLKLYLNMEMLRFKDAFTYSLCCDDKLDPTSLFIPPLLLQPFVENAIWHGLMHKKGNGKLVITFKEEKDIFFCDIIDDGVGRAMAKKAGSKSSQSHKSMGIQITKDRLALINGNMLDEKVAFEIVDLFDDEGHSAGTRVSLRIKFQQNDHLKELYQ